MSVFARLSALQFFQNAIYAATVVALGTYLLRTLQFSGREVGLVYATAAIAATLAPPITGWLADSRFSVERMLTWLSLGAAAALVACFFATSFAAFYVAILAFNLCFMPTFGLLNSACFHLLERPAEQFPVVRAWGTGGFMVFGVALSLLGWEDAAFPLLLGVAGAVSVAVVALSLPPIPPQPGFSLSDLRSEETRKIIRAPGMAVLMVAMLLSCIPSSFYYSFVNPFLNEVGMSAAAAKMSLGQVGEVFVLLSAPFAFRTIRFRRIVFIGLFLWGARYFAFAYGRPGDLEWLLYLGILVQGFAFVWIVVAAQIYVDKRVPKALRSTAQGLIVFANQGVGMIIGSWLAGEIVGAHALPGGTHAWQLIWLFPGVVGVAAAFLFWAFFPRLG